MVKTRGLAAGALLGWALCAVHPAMAQDPVDGVCDDSTRNGCTAGTPNDAAFPDTATGYLWRCDGLHGGRNSEKCHIRVADVVDGVCDESVRNGCSAGTANAAAFPDTSNAYLWRCDGSGGGANSEKCLRFMPVDGVCNDNVRNGCTAGTPNDEAHDDNPSGYLWRCDGLHGGRNSDKCFIRVENVVNGACDESVRNGCSAGTANDDAFPDSSTAYAWRCDGSNGGDNSERCSKFIPVDGVCNDSVRNGCTAGTPNDEAHEDIPTGYLWRCDGLHGGRNSDKCFIRVEDVPVDGVCDESVRNGCSAGTANDLAVPDSANAYLWRCDGLHGGANSEKCLKSIGVNGACDNSVRNGCSAGTANDAAIADTTSHYQWRCDGTDGGSNSGTCSVAKPVAQISCGNAAWSPATSTVCSGQPFTQRRTCNAGCNTGDCSTSRGATGTQYCETLITCGTAQWSEWSPAPSTQACDATFTQTSTRTCNPGCNVGSCEETEQRLVLGTQERDCQWGSWGTCVCTASTADASNAGTQSRSVAVSAGCGGDPCPSSPPRSCTVAANDCEGPPCDCNCTPSVFDPASAGDCSDSDDDCTVSDNDCPVCGTCNCTDSVFDDADDGDCGSSPGTSCTVSPATCPVCGTCGCTDSVFDPASAGVCSSSGDSCTVSPATCPVCGTCRCTNDTSDSASAGVCSNGGAACTVSAGNCTVSCGESWPSTPTETNPGGWDCFGSGSEGGNYCEWGIDVYRRDCATECNDGDCSEVKAGERRIIGRCLGNSPRCGPS